jgi:FKBP-type peptidyl-prolyl cis-trans isomerase (trigger factor)
MQAGVQVEEGDAKKLEEMADTPLTDEEAKPLGFENAQAFEHFLEGEARKAVADRSIQKKRAVIAEALIGSAACDIPKVIVDEEARALLEATKRDIASRGVTWNEYLKRINKGETNVLNDLKPAAEKRVSLDLVFGEIIRREKLQLGEDEKKKEEELAHKIEAQGVPHDRAHAYVREQLLREKVWDFLGAKADNGI